MILYQLICRKTVIIALGLWMMALGCQQETVGPPAPVYPIPSQRQLDWQTLEFYAFIHFNMNTFTDKEWGTGGEDPSQFNPTKLDCRQWAKTFKDAGMKGIIITAKHHDGFCLWPSKYTEHSVKNSPWRNGEGDLIRELADACKEFGLKLGIYYSPWDRNHTDYGKPEYLDYMRNQLTELLTNYGDLFEVWFDGANGGTGYYGGANEDRRVDKKGYYQWPAVHALVRKLQPDAVIFGDAGPDVRWVGNEKGFAYPTTWSNLMRDSVYAGMPEYSKQYSAGQEDGSHWVPAEVDVSIRPGWYYHPEQDDKVKSLQKLMDIYYESIGRNGSLLLNFPVDDRGLVHENDVRQLNKMAKQIRLDFAEELVKGSPVSATNVRGKGFEAALAVDGNPDTYWATEDEIAASSLTIELSEPTTFNRFLIQEYIPLGQRVKSFSVEVKTSSGWKQIDRQTTIGYKRILRFADVTGTAIRLNILDAKACPAISNIEVYRAPPLHEEAAGHS